MKHSVVVFFFASNNHISNVKTLQSVLKQDYDNISLIVCNDSTYGFDSERLLNNFQEYKKDNVRQIYFHENHYSIGEYNSLKQYQDHICGDYLVILHAGEYFTTPTALRECVAHLKQDPSLDMVMAGSEIWTDNFSKKLSTDFVVGNCTNRVVVQDEAAINIQDQNIRDCMAIYRLEVFYNNLFALDKQYSHISRYMIPKLIENGIKSVCIPNILCKYSEASVQSFEVAEPTEFGNHVLQNIEKMLQYNANKAKQEENKMFQTNIKTHPIKKKKNIWIMIYKLSSFVRIKSYATMAVLLSIAAGVFFNVGEKIMTDIGCLFLVGAIFIVLWTFCMCICNIYLKKNPQRLVM